MGAATTKGLNLGIEVAENNLSLALCGAKNGQGLFEVRALQTFDGLPSAIDASNALKGWVKQNQLKGVSCNVTLGVGQYQLLLTEAPDVPQQELRDALRWKVKELSSIPIDEAAIDVFPLPVDGARSSKAMAYVVVSELSQVKDIVAMVKGAELKLNAIDISELSLRNLSLLKPEGQVEARGLGVVQVLPGRAIVYLYREGSLYLSRQFNLEYQGGLLDEIPEDSFLLEVQRSLDYYERQMRQTPPVTLYICGENISEDKVGVNISRGLSVPAKYLNLEELFSLNDDELNADLLQQCSVALGAALRDQVRVV